MKKKIIFLIFFILLSTFSMNVFAKEKVELNVDKNSVKSNDEITVSINFSGENSYAYTAKLSYDKDVFEEIETEDFQEQNDWAEVTYNSANNKFALIKKMNENQTEENGDKLVQVKLKVKDNAKAGKSTISINSITASNGITQSKLDKQSADVEVLKEGLEKNESIPSNKTTDIEEEDISVKVEKNVSPFSIISIILAIGIIAFLIWYNIKKKNSNKNKIIITITGVAIALILLIPSIKNLTKRSEDVNNNGIIDKEDTNEIIDYLLDIKNDENIENKDVNNNGEISVVDVAQNVRAVINQRYSGNASSGKSTKSSNKGGVTTDSGTDSNNGGNSGTGSQTGGSGNEGGSYGEDNPPIPQNKEVKINSFKLTNNSNEEVYFIEKGQPLKATFTIETNTNETITHVTINSVSIPVKKNNDGTYTVTFNAPKDAYGEVTLEVTKVRLKKSGDIKVYSSIKVEILKSIKPKIENPTIDKTQNPPILSFDVVDPEDTFVSGEIVITNKNTNETKTIDFNSKENNSYKLEGIEEGIEYDIEIKATYDFDTNKKDAEHQNTETIGKTSLKIEEKTKASITKAEAEIYYVEKGQELKIKYTVDSNKQEGLKGITLENNAFYPIECKNEDGTYTVSIPIPSNVQYGKATIKPLVVMYEFESGPETVILDKTKEVEYYVLKDKPSIENYTFDGKTTVKFNFKNKENAKINDKTAQIVIKDENGDSVKTQALNIKNADTEQGAENTLDLKDLENGNYTITLEGIFDLDDKANDGENEHSFSEIFEEKQIQVISKYTASIDVKEFKVTKENESTKAVITFACENTTNEDVEWIVVNGTRYKVSKQSDNTYIAEITDIEDAKELQITDVVLKDDNQVQLLETKTYEIFKTKPTVTDITINTDTDPISAQFTVNDEDSTITALKAVIKDSEGNQIGDPVDVKGKTNVEFKKPEQAGKYTIEFLADFDCVDGDNYENIKINNDGTTEFSVDLKVTANLVPDSLSKYIGKEKTFTLKYNITANINKEITTIEINGNEEKFELVDGNYEITLTAPSNYGEKSYSITKIKFEGDTEGVTPENNEAKIYVLKTAPTMKDFKLNKDNDLAKISFYVVNDDLVRMDADAVIKEKETGKEIIRKEDITSGLNEIELKKDDYEFKGNMLYELTFEGMYDLDDTEDPIENEHNITDIFKNELFQLEIKAKITNCEIPNPYVKKGKTVELKYTIDANTEISVSHIKVNGELLEVKTDGKKYSVTYTSKEEGYGNLESVKANAVIFGDEEISVEEREDKIQVLKRVPTVPKTYEIDENYDEKTITVKFNIIDYDNTLEKNSTYVTLGGGKFKDKDGRARVPVKVGEGEENRNEVTFVKVEPHKVLMLDVVGNYDLDTDELNEITKRDDNEYKDKAITRLPAMLFPPSDLKISNIVAKDTTTGETIKYLNKNQQFNLSFTSKTFTENLGDTSNSFYPVSIKVER